MGIVSQRTCTHPNSTVVYWETSGEDHIDVCWCNKCKLLWTRWWKQPADPKKKTMLVGVNFSPFPA